MASRRSRLQIRPNVIPKAGCGASKPEALKEVHPTASVSEANAKVTPVQSPRRRRVSSQCISPPVDKESTEHHKGSTRRPPSPRKRTISNRGHSASNVLSESSSSNIATKPVSFEASENETTTENSSTGTPPAPISGRRSRIKPAVCVGRRGRGSVKQDEPVLVTTDDTAFVTERTDTHEFTSILSKPELDKKSEDTNLSSIDVSGESPSSEALQRDTVDSAPVSTDYLSPPDRIESRSKPTYPPERTSLSSLPPTPTPTAPARRNRFIKARPNLIDTTRNRPRHASISDAEEETSLRSLPPVIRTVHNPSQKAKTIEVAASSVPPTTSHDGSNCEAISQDELPAHTNVKSTEAAPKRTRRSLQKLTDPVDRSKLTMTDLIYMNPTENPMKGIADKKKRQTDAVTSDLTSIVDPVEPAPPECNPVDADDGDDDVIAVPQVKIGPDGSIIVNEKSLVLDSPQTKAGPVVGEAIDETDLVFTSGAYSNKVKGSRKKWSLKETKKFFVALSMIGTDFTMMSQLFPHRSRLDIKRKFKKEDRHHSELIERALKEKRGFNMSLLEDPQSSSSEEEDVPRKENKPSKAMKKSLGRKKRAAKKPADPVQKKKPKRSRSRFYDSSSDEGEVEEPLVAEDGAGDDGTGEDGEETKILEKLSKTTTRVGRRPRQTVPFTTTPASVTSQPAVKKPRVKATALSIDLTKSPVKQVAHADIVTPMSPSHQPPTRSSPLRSSPMRSTAMKSPPPFLRLSVGQGGAPSQFLTLSQLGMVIPNMEQLPAGQLVVVPQSSSGPHGENQPPIMHVFMVSPPTVLGPTPPPVNTVCDVSHAKSPLTLLNAPQGVTTNDTHLTDPPVISAEISSVLESSSQAPGALQEVILRQAEVISKQMEDGSYETLIAPNLE